MICIIYCFICIYSNIYIYIYQNNNVQLFYGFNCHNNLWAAHVFAELGAFNVDLDTDDHSS